MQQHHYPFLLAIVLGVAVVLGFYFISVGSIVAPTTDNPLVVDQNTGAPDSLNESAQDSSATAPKVSSEPVGGQRVFENGIAVTIIYLTKSGFSPREVTISAGEEVRFINATDGTMSIGTEGTLSTAFYSSFSQPTPKGKGGTFQIGLTKQGLWTYKNLNTSNSAATGVVYIR